MRDFYGNRLTLPVEHALEIVSGRMPRCFLNTTCNTLSEVMIGIRRERDEVQDRCDFNGGQLMDARGTIERVIEMIRATTRFQHSKDGKAIREFLEIRLRMLYGGKTEEQVRMDMANNAA